jgi:hypothetical protein
MNSTAPSDETSSVAPPSISSWVALGGEPHPNYYNHHCNHHLIGHDDDDDEEYDDHDEYYDDWGVPNCQPSPPMDLSNMTIATQMEINTPIAQHHPNQQQQQQQQLDKENVLPTLTSHHPTSKNNQTESESEGAIVQKQGRTTYWPRLQRASVGAATTTPKSTHDKAEVDLPNMVTMTDHDSTSEQYHSNSSLLLGLSFCSSLPSSSVGGSSRDGGDPTAVTPSVISLPTGTTTDAVSNIGPTRDIGKQQGDDHGVCLLQKTSKMARTSAVSFGDDELELPKGVTTGSITTPMTMMEPDEWVGSDGCHASSPPRSFFPATTDNGASISTIVTDRSSIVPAALDKGRRRMMILPMDNPNLKPPGRHYSSTLMAGRMTHRKGSTTPLTMGTVPGRPSQPGAIRVSSKIPNTIPSSSRTLMSALTSSVFDDTSTITSSTHPHRLPEAEALHDDDEDEKYLPHDIEQMLVEGYSSTASSMVVNRSTPPIVLDTADVCLVEENDKQDTNSTDHPMCCGLTRLWAVVVLVMLMVCVLLGSTLGTLLSGDSQRGPVAPPDAISNNSNTQGGTQGTIVPSYSPPTSSSGTFTTMAPSEITSTMVVTPAPKSSPPSPKPSPSPSSAPTRSPVTPVPLVVAAPTVATTPEPTPYVSPAPNDASSSTCIDSVQTTQSCYDRSSMTKVTVNFVNCQPRDDDWIAIFPSNEPSDYLLNDQLWVYACGGQSCSEAVSQGTVDIDPADYDTSESSRTLTPTDPNDGSYLFFPVPAGTYRIHLIREVGTGVVDPFVAYASSAYFTLSDNGC